MLPGGNSRHSVTMNPYPIYVSSANGFKVKDVEGEERLDFINNMTSLIHGHAHPAIVEAVSKQLEKGTAFAMPTEPELELANLLVDRIDSIDKIRFCNSGSEAVMLSIKAAQRGPDGQVQDRQDRGSLPRELRLRPGERVRQPR